MAAKGINTDLDFSAPSSSTPAVGASKLLKILTASRAAVSNASGDLVASAVTATELGYLSGVTSAIQTQLNSKISSGGGAIVNADIAAGAAIALSKLAALTVSRALVSDGSGVVSVSPTTATQIAAINALTNGRVPFSSGGVLADSANLLFSGAALTILGNAVVTGNSTGYPEVFRLGNSGASVNQTRWAWQIPGSTAGSRDGAYEIVDFGGTPRFTIQYPNFLTGINSYTQTAQLEVVSFSSTIVTQKLKVASGATANAQEIQNSGGVVQRAITAVGKSKVSGTLTAAGTTGAQTINKPSGRVNFAAAATSLVVTCDQCNTSCIIKAFVQTNDTTMKSVIGVAASGSFTLYPNAAPTAETAVFFEVVEIV